MDHFIHTNGIQLHLLDFEGPGETIILMHGLTANAHSFSGLVAAGLNQHMRVIAPDLRGRGQSDKPASGYTMDDHAADILGLMDVLGLPSVVMSGHSYGGLLTMYLAAHYPDRVTKMMVIDSGLMPANVLDIIKPSLDRLGKALPSWEAYRDAMKAAPYYHDGFWTDELEAYYRADVETLPDGSVKPRSTPEAIAEAARTGLEVDWPGTMARATQPALLMYSPEGFGPPGAPPIMSDEAAQTTAAMLPNCRAVKMTGNHITMLHGQHAPHVVATMRDFVNGTG